MDTQPEIDRGIYRPEIFKAAQASGRFYNAFIDAYLENGALTREPRVDQLIEELPHSMQGLYKDGIKRYREELASNHELVQAHKGSEVSYLLSSVLRGQEKPEEEISEIIGRATVDKARFIEPSNGVCVIEAEKDFFRLLQQKGLILGEAGAVCFQSHDRSEPSFLIVRRLSLQKSLSERGITSSEEPNLRHEFHHLIWNFLERSRFVREINETTPELSEAFRHFRDEVSAYILERGTYDSFDTIEPELLIYTKDVDILSIAQDAADYGAVCMKLAEQMGVNSQTFLYATMTARNFAEFKAKFFSLTPLSSKIEEKSLDILYRIFSHNSHLRPALGRLLEQKGVIVNPELLPLLASRHLSSQELQDFSQLISKKEQLNEFASSLGLSSTVIEDMFRQTLGKRIPLPEETIEIFLELPLDITRWLPLDKSLDDFIKRFISFWSVVEDEKREVYSKILDSSSIVRQVFDRLKQEIVGEEAEGYRNEMGSHKTNKELELEIQRRTDLIMSL